MAKPIASVIFGLSGLSLTDAERSFFERVNPLGFILFDRNVKNPDQLRALTADLRATVGRSDAPILVDQEGGRVQRLWPPYWDGLPFAGTYGDWYVEQSAEKAMNAVVRHAEKLADMLLDVGINVDCWPCLDVASSDIHPVLGKRLFSDQPEIVSILGNTAVETMLNKGLMPVIKHIPGYGKATCDPHADLPVVSADLTTLETDFYPFRQADKHVWGMTAHVLYTALDNQKPATVSRSVLDFVRREIGFQGFLVCDDISMGALKGAVDVLAKECLTAGCDAVLHCNGQMADMERVAAVIPPLSDQSLARYVKAESLKNG